ncbi:MAG: hypothetical protein ABSE73_00180 [Planctomycetota bacterium]
MKKAVLAVIFCFAAWAEDHPPLYPVLLKQSEVYQNQNFKFQRAGFEMEFKDVRLVMVDSEKGVTGAVLLGEGTFSFAHKTYKLGGQVSAALLRFNPDEYQALTQVDKAQRLADLGVYELGRSVWNSVARYCWQGDNGRLAMLPPKGQLSVILYTKDHGNVLISQDSKEVIVWGITEKKDLYKNEVQEQQQGQF